MTEMDMIKQWHGQIEINKMCSALEAEHKASIFLSATAHLSTWKHLYSELLIKARSDEKLIYSQLMKETSSKKVTENKILVEGMPEYRKVADEVARLETAVTTLRSFYEVFTHAHVFFRQLAKGEVI